MYTVDMPNVCLKKFTAKDIQTHCLFEFFKAPYARFTYRSFIICSCFHMARSPIILSYFIDVDDAGTVRYGQIELVTSTACTQTRNRRRQQLEVGQVAAGVELENGSVPDRAQPHTPC
jgi:hypothetical protein